MSVEKNVLVFMVGFLCATTNCEEEEPWGGSWVQRGPKRFGELVSVSVFFFYSCQETSSPKSWCWEPQAKKRSSLGLVLESHTVHIADFEGVPGNFSKVRGGERFLSADLLSAIGGGGGGQIFSSSKVKRQRNSLQVGLLLSCDKTKEREWCGEVR